MKVTTNTTSHVIARTRIGRKGIAFREYYMGRFGEDHVWTLFELKAKKFAHLGQATKEIESNRRAMRGASVWKTY